MDTSVRICLHIYRILGPHTPSSPLSATSTLHYTYQSTICFKDVVLTIFSMKAAVILGALAVLAAAAPAPQLIDLDGVASIEVPPAGPSSDISVAQPDAFDAVAATKAAAASVQTASAKRKRTYGTCAPQQSTSTQSGIPR